MTIITITKGSKEEIDLLVDYAQKLGVEISVSDEMPIVKAQKANKKELINQLSQKTNRNISKRLLDLHNISSAHDSHNR